MLFYVALTFYRVEETLNRQFSANGISAAFNDSMVYGYRGVANYTSTFSSDIVKFMADMGYYDGEHYIYLMVNPIWLLIVLWG